MLYSKTLDFYTMLLTVSAVQFSVRQIKLLSIRLVISTANYKGIKYQHMLSFGKCEKFHDNHHTECL